jgi:hypothetical protein
MEVGLLDVFGSWERAADRLRAALQHLFSCNKSSHYSSYRSFPSRRGHHRYARSEQSITSHLTLPQRKVKRCRRTSSTIRTSIRRQQPTSNRALIPCTGRDNFKFHLPSRAKVSKHPQVHLDADDGITSNRNSTLPRAHSEPRRAFRVDKRLRSRARGMILLRVP